MCRRNTNQAEFCPDSQENAFMGTKLTSFVCAYSPVALENSRSDGNQQGQNTSSFVFSDAISSRQTLLFCPLFAPRRSTIAVRSANRQGTILCQVLPHPTRVILDKNADPIQASGFQRTVQQCAPRLSKIIPRNRARFLAGGIQRRSRQERSGPQGRQPSSD